MGTACDMVLQNDSEGISFNSRQKMNPAAQ